MSLNPFLANKLVDLTNQQGDIKSCIEFGNQRFLMDDNSATKLFNKLHVSDYESKLKELEGDKDRLYGLTRFFYKNLGIEKYETIDLNGFDGAHKFDLNLDVKSNYNYNHSYDLVINNGTSEHVFDQKNVFLNSHNLTSEGGFMIHLLPFFSWVNHGFYNFNPILFFDLAATNNYEVVDFSIGNRNKELIKTNNSQIENIDKTQPEKGLKLFFERQNQINLNLNKFSNIKRRISHFLELLRSYTKSKEDLSFVELSDNIVFPYKGRNLSRQMLKAFRSDGQTSSSPFADLSILVILKKLDQDPFVIPLQGKYQSDYEI